MSEPKTHYLKTWPDVFEETWQGRKLHEWRRDDRGFELGDHVVLEEFEPAGERYLGRTIRNEITFISKGPEWGIPEGYAVFSLRIISRSQRGSNDGREASGRDGGIGSADRSGE